MIILNIMKQHLTKEKGNIAVAKTICDLTEKGYTTFTPTISEHLPFDVLAYKDNVFYRIQVKYSADGMVNKRSSWANKQGTHNIKYNKSDFDYYAIYLPNINTVIYPSSSFKGYTIRTIPPTISCEFWWWEDFTTFTDIVKMRNI